MEGAESRDKSVTAQIDVRIKRLRAMMEIATQRDIHSEKLKNVPRPNAGLSIVLILSVVWVGGGLFLLYFIEKRYSVAGFSVPLKIYLLFLLAFLVPPAYFYITRERDRRARDGSDDVDALRVVIEQFYEPLKKAVERDDLKAIEGIAARLIEDPLLSEAFRSAHEGDARKAAYALYAYVRFRQGAVGRDEVEEAYLSVGNRALKSILASLLDSGADVPEETESESGTETQAA
ncbi:MAG: hypothetical protein GXO14_05060 [Thermococci archaeon]|nr:hypothetical protein [Thermococci archaeon]